MNSNESYRCLSDKKANCDLLPAGVSGVIVYPKAFRADLFLSRDYLMASQSGPRLLPDPISGPPLVQSALLAVSSDLIAQPSVHVGATFNTAASLGRNAFISEIIAGDRWRGRSPHRAGSLARTQRPAKPSSKAAACPSKHHASADPRRRHGARQFAHSVRDLPSWAQFLPGIPGLAQGSRRPPVAGAFIVWAAASGFGSESRARSAAPGLALLPDPSISDNIAYAPRTPPACHRGTQGFACPCAIFDTDTLARFAAAARPLPES